MKKLFMFLLGASLLVGGRSFATPAANVNYYHDDWYDLDDRYENDVDDRLEDQYERAYYQQQLNALQQQNAWTSSTPSSSETAVDHLSWNTDQYTGLMAAGVSAVALIDKYGVWECSLNGQPVPCGELLNISNELIPAIEQLIPGGVQGLVKFAFTIMLISIVLGIIGFVFWIWMLIDAITHQKENQVIWVLLIVFLNVIGALIYFFAARIRRNKENLHPQSPSPQMESPSKDIVDVG